MEAINNIASAATKAIWGEPAKGDIAPPPVNQEPISGVQGNPSKGEPFDAGNAQENNITVGGEQSQTNPSAAQASSTTTGDSTKAQIDTRDPADEQTSPSVATRKNDVNNVEPLDPSIVKGPGPKPLDQVAREHGGDAGNAAHDAASSSAKAEGQAPSPNAAGGAAPEEGKKLEREGTGEKLVRSSGLVADGGDFDAANPGAGREADRLLEQKGIHHEKTPPASKVSSADSKSGSPTGESSSPERKGVRGLGHKIKAKLHRSSNA